MQSLAFFWRELKNAKQQLNEAFTDGQESDEKKLTAQKGVQPEPNTIVTQEQVTDEGKGSCQKVKPPKRSSSSDGCSWARV
jgi:hypothetical protein